VTGGKWQVAGGRWQVAGGRWQVEHTVILSKAKDLFASEPSSKLSSGLKRSFVATLLRMTAVADG
jgi:hypothetical protein